MSYENGLIYTITCKDPEKDFTYVGSTINFRNRKYCHKSDCYNQAKPQYNQKVYKTIRENGGWENFIMKTYSKFPCSTKTELDQEEERVRELIGGNLNSNKAYSKLKGADYSNHYNIEYKATHKEETKEYNKQYYEKNKDRLTEIKQCECGGRYSYYTKSKHLKTKRHIKHTT